jgi:Ca2+-binding EF-hand superfamily protein
MQSILLAREKYYSDRNTWWSVKPKEYQILKDKDYFHQIAGQVFYTDKAIRESFEKIPLKNKIEVSYEDFCQYPQETYKKIVHKYAQNNFSLKSEYNGRSSFQLSRSIELKKSEIQNFKEAYSFFDKEKFNEKKY